MGGFDIGASASTAISSQSGAAQSGVGDFVVTFGNEGGGLSGLLPKTPANQAWIVYVIAGAVAIVGLIFWLRK